MTDITHWTIATEPRENSLCPHKIQCHEMLFFLSFFLVFILRLYGPSKMSSFFSFLFPIPRASFGTVIAWVWAENFLCLLHVVAYFVWFHACLFVYLKHWDNRHVHGRHMTWYTLTHRREWGWGIGGNEISKLVDTRSGKYVSVHVHVTECGQYDSNSLDEIQRYRRRCTAAGVSFSSFFLCKKRREEEEED